MIIRKSKAAIDTMAAAGRIVADTLALLAESLEPGLTMRELDRIGDEYIASQGAYPTSKGYKGFPAAICISPNDMIVHGIPGAYALEEGDILSIDCGAIIEGYHGDAAFTMAIGEVSAEAARLMEATERSLWAGIDQLRDGNRLHEVGRAVQEVAEGAGFSVVREYVGHAIGTAMHEEPQVPNYWPGQGGPMLKSGMVFAVEPMVNAGGAATRVLEDGWSVVTTDGKLSAHFEHTIAVTDDGPEVLTLP
jgi:methionyl aminopeptidase